MKDRELFEQIYEDYFKDQKGQYSAEKNILEIKKIFYNKEYKKIIGLTEEETGILRTKYKSETEFLTYKQLQEKKEIPNIINKIAYIKWKLAHITAKICIYYQNNNIKEQTKIILRKPIELLPLKNNIKEMLKNNEIYTLEELLIIENINWKKEKIKDIIELLRLIKKNNLNFSEKNYIRDRMKNSKLTINEINELNENNIYVLDDLLKYTIVDIRKIETMSDELKNKIEKLQINMEKNSTILKN